MGELDGKVGIVTGGASGIGRAVALGLSAHGAAVAILDKDIDRAEGVAKEITEAGAVAAPIQLDLASPDSIKDAVSTVVSTLDRIDILVNCAGIVGVGASPEHFGPTTSVLQASLEAWDLIYAVNTRAPFLMMQLVAREMVRRGEGGRIVNLSSSSAYRAHAPVPYASSKAAVSALTRNAAAELGPYGINVNAVAPGVTATPMNAHKKRDDMLAEVTSGPMQNLLGRFAEPEDVANVVVFLCLPASRQITAQTIHTSAGAVV
jgi:NAD(P)-dependent dehydrogenase (short-subunit alcohol dehydrogenase family)